MLRTIFVQSSTNGIMMKQAVIQQNKGVIEHRESELKLLCKGDSLDPRLVALVRLLARRAAREWYSQMAKERPPRRS